MLNTIIGLKEKMSQTFVEGRRVTVTKVKVAPCVVTQVKTMEKDGYWGLQLGVGERTTKNVSKALQGHLKTIIKNNTAPRYLLEVKFDKEPQNKQNEAIKIGDTITLSDIFSLGDVINVTGISKGKGFAGAVKRWHFHGGPRTHGQSDRERAPGSIGAGTTPGRIYKGKHMAGRMGSDRVTVKNLQVVSLDDETNEMEVSGPVPGVTGAPLILKRVSKGKLEGIVEVQAAIVEGEPEAEGEVKTEESQAVKPEEKKEEVANA
jgi:large subunit ribosomal protein L3